MHKFSVTLFNTNQSALKYILNAALYSTIPALALSYILSSLFPNLQFPEFPGSPALLVFSVVILSPIIETLLMWPLIALLSRFTSSTIKISIVSALVWAILHSLSAPIWGVTIFLSFVIFSICFIVWRKKSLKKAYWMTCGVHMTQNAVATLLMLIEG